MARISKIMNPGVLTLKKEAIVSDAVKLMANKPHGCVVIVESKKPIGIITESDIVRNLASKKINAKAKVTEMMSSPVTTLDCNTKLEKANKIMDTKNFRRYPVMDKDKLVGFVTENEIVHAINDNIKLHRYIQNAVLVTFVVFEFFVFVLYKELVSIFSFLK